MRKIFDYILKFMMSRAFILAMIMLLQLGLILLSLYSFSWESRVIRGCFTILNLILTIYIVNRQVNMAYKLAWVILIFFVPIVGGIIYLMFAEHRIPKSLRRESMKELLQSKDIYEEHKKAIKIKDDAVAKQFEYVHQHASYPYYENTAVHYFSSGEEYFNDLLDKLKKAQNFIFLEFFIVKDGMMLQQILDVLKERVQAGVQVYFMYDDGGSITCLPKDFNKTLDQCGIHNVVFNPVSLWLIFLSKYNNRDHRKICVIDNEYGYMGGLNIADEYINKIVRFGHWKDSAVRLQGEGVASLTTMFIQFYNVCAPYKKLDFRNFLLPIDPVEAKGIVLPFSDSPTDDEDVSHTVHLNMIARAERYVYIHTPYLILDEQLIGVLQSAAKSGVEVIITVPKIPDKKTVFMVTRSNYEALLKAGVRIFEYTPGFIHSKLFISDDRIALCGTINMDYRSYFLHYECGTLIAYDDEIMKMKEDYLNTLKVSQEITLEDVYARPFIVRVIQAVLAIFAPLF